MPLLQTGSDVKVNEYIKARDILLKPNPVSAHVAQAVIPNVVRRLCDIINNSTDENWINRNLPNIIGEITAIKIADKRYNHVLSREVINELDELETDIINRLEAFGDEVSDTLSQENDNLRQENIRLRNENDRLSSERCWC